MNPFSSGTPLSNQWSSISTYCCIRKQHLDPASYTLPASGKITQNLRVTNNQHGKKSLVMRMRIGYKLNGKDVLEEGQINNSFHL